MSGFWIFVLGFGIGAVAGVTVVATWVTVKLKPIIKDLQTVERGLKELR